MTALTAAWGFYFVSSFLRSLGLPLLNPVWRARSTSARISATPNPWLVPSWYSGFAFQRKHIKADRCAFLFTIEPRHYSHYHRKGCHRAIPADRVELSNLHLLPLPALGYLVISLTIQKGKQRGKQKQKKSNRIAIDPCGRMVKLLSLILLAFGCPRESLI